MADYTVSDLSKAAYAAGFRGTDLLIAVSVALAENPGRQLRAVNHNSNGTVDRGPWQINSVHNFNGNPYDLNTNAKQAYAVFQSQGWGAWTTYANGAYKMQAHKAQVGVKRAGLLNQTLQDIAQGALGPKNLGDHIGDAITGTAGGIVDAGKGAIKAADAIPTLISHILSPSFWRVVGIGALAVLLVIIGIIVMLESNKTVRNATVTAGKVAAV